MTEVEGRKPLDERAHNLIMNEFYKNAEYSVNALRQSQDLNYILFVEDCDIRSSEVYRAILQGMNELSEDRAILLELVTQLLDWRKAVQKDRESSQAKLYRDFIFFSALLELRLEGFSQDDAQLATLFTLCWEQLETKYAEIPESRLATEILAANKDAVDRLCLTALAHLYPFRFGYSVVQLDRFYHLKTEKAKKKIDKKEMDVLLDFMAPLVCGEVNLNEKKGFTEFRENLEKTFITLFGTWKDKKKENSPFKCLFRCMQDKQEIGPRWLGWLGEAKKKLDTLDQVRFLVSIHIRHFTNTVTEMEKEKLSKKLLECKCTNPRQQNNLLEIIRDVGLRAHEAGLALKWCLELIHNFLDSKVFNRKQIETGVYAARILIASGRVTLDSMETITLLRKKLLHLLSTSKEVSGNPQLLNLCLAFVLDVLPKRDDELSPHFTQVIANQLINASEPGISFRCGSSLAKIIQLHPILRPKVVGQVAEFIAEFWLQGEMDMQETAVAGAFDKLVLLLKEWKVTDIDGTACKDPEVWLDFVEGLSFLMLVCTPSTSVRARVLNILHLTRQLLPRLFPRGLKEKDRSKRVMDVLYDCYHLYHENPDPNPEFDHLEPFTTSLYKQMEGNKLNNWSSLISACLRECPNAMGVTWQLVVAKVQQHTNNKESKEKAPKEPIWWIALILLGCATAHPDAASLKNPHLSGVVENRTLGSFLEIILKGEKSNFSKETAVQALKRLPSAGQTYKALFAVLSEKVSKKAWTKPFISAVMDTISRNRLDQLDRETFRVGHALLKDFVETINLPIFTLEEEMEGQDLVIGIKKTVRFHFCKVIQYLCQHCRDNELNAFSSPVCQRIFHCLNRWCADDLTKFKLDMKKEEKEWDKPISLSAHLKNELHTLHKVASKAIASLLSNPFDERMRLNSKTGLQGSVISWIDNDITHADIKISSSASLGLKRFIRNNCDPILRPAGVLDIPQTFTDIVNKCYDASTKVSSGYFRTLVNACKHSEKDMRLGDEVVSILFFLALYKLNDAMAKNRRRAVRLLELISPTVIRTFAVDLFRQDVVPFYSLIINCSLQSDISYTRWQYELNSRLAPQGDVEHVVLVFLREMLVRVAQNTECKRIIFRTIDWLFPWLARLESLKDTQILEYLFKLIKDNHVTYPDAIQKMWCILARMPKNIPTFMPYLIDETKWTEMKVKVGYDLDLAKWLLLAMTEKNILKKATQTLEDKSEARNVNKAIVAAFVTEMEKIALSPDAEHHRNSLYFLAELLSEIPLEEYSEHLPKILHIVFLGSVNLNAPSIVSEHNSLLFASVMNLFQFQLFYEGKKSWETGDAFVADQIHQGHIFAAPADGKFPSPKVLSDIDALITKVCAIVFKEGSKYFEGRRQWTLCALDFAFRSATVQMKTMSYHIYRHLLSLIDFTEYAALDMQQLYRHFISALETFNDNATLSKHIIIEIINTLQCIFTLVYSKERLSSFPELFWLPVAMLDKCVHKNFPPLQLILLFSELVTKLNSTPKLLGSFCTEIAIRNPDQRFVGFQPLITMSLLNADPAAREEIMQLFFTFTACLEWDPIFLCKNLHLFIRNILGILPFYSEHIHKNPDFTCEKLALRMYSWAEDPLVGNLGETLRVLATVFETSWASSADLIQHLSKNIIDLDLDKDFKVAYYVWLLDAKVNAHVVPVLMKLRDRIGLEILFRTQERHKNIPNEKENLFCFNDIRQNIWGQVHPSRIVEPLATPKYQPQAPKNKDNKEKPPLDVHDSIRRPSTKEQPSRDVPITSLRNKDLDGYVKNNSDRDKARPRSSRSSDRPSSSSSSSSSSSRDRRKESSKREKSYSSSSSSRSRADDDEKSHRRSSRDDTRRADRDRRKDDDKDRKRKEDEKEEERRRKEREREEERRRKEKEEEERRKREEKEMERERKREERERKREEERERRKRKKEEEERREAARQQEGDSSQDESYSSPRSKSIHNSDDSGTDSDHDRNRSNSRRETKAAASSDDERSGSSNKWEKEREESSSSRARSDSLQDSRGGYGSTDSSDEHESDDTESEDEGKDDSDREEEDRRRRAASSTVKKEDPIEEKEKEAIAQFWTERTNELQKILESGNAIYSDDLYLPIVEEEPLEEVLHCPANSSKELLLYALTKAMAYFKLMRSAIVNPSNEWEDREEVEDILQMIDETLRRSYAKLSM